MIFLLRGTDIGFLTVGLGRTAEALQLVTYATRPEEYLRVTQEFLERQHVGLKDIAEVYLVSGEGSATALRASVTLVNALAWANGWTMRELVVPTTCGEEELYTRLSGASVVQVARPHYATDPHITQATHDALKRKM